jgi:hypothetical protein
VQSEELAGREKPMSIYDQTLDSPGRREATGGQDEIGAALMSALGQEQTFRLFNGCFTLHSGH